MIRHSSSFLVSLLIHVALFGVLFISYKYIYAAKSEAKEESVVCVKLCCVVESEAPKEVVKKSPSKPVQKLLPEKKIEPKKTSPRKEIPKKDTPKIVETPAKEEHNTQKSIEELDELTESPAQASAQKPDRAANFEKKEQKSIEESYIDEHLQRIVQLLQENLYYPRRARKRGIEGEVLVRFHMSVDATVSRVEIQKSENEILSRAAIETIENLSGKFPAPSESLVLSIPITYTLKQAD